MSERAMKKGFTLVEVMAAGAIISVAITGSLVGLIATQKQIRQSSYTISIARLIDARMQRYSLAKKDALSGTCVSLALPSLVDTYNDASLTPAGTIPWATEPNASTFQDGLGSYFKVNPTGEVSYYPDPSVGVHPSGTCAPGNASMAPGGGICVEEFCSLSLPSGDTQVPSWGATDAKNATPITVWIRVWDMDGTHFGKKPITRSGVFFK